MRCPVKTRKATGRPCQRLNARWPRRHRAKADLSERLNEEHDGILSRSLPGRMNTLEHRLTATISLQDQLSCYSVHMSLYSYFCRLR
jgi:hypothetical protein